jgi:hypothetical protein
MSPALDASPKPKPRHRGWTHYIHDEFFDRLELDPLFERLILRLERFARDRPWCNPTNDELMRELGCSHNTLAVLLARGEAQGWFRRVLIPGRHGRATARLGFVLLRRPTDRPVANDETYDLVVARMTAELRRRSHQPRTIPFDAEAPRPTVGGTQSLGTAVPNGWVPPVPSDWVPPSIKEEVTGEETKTTTTDEDDAQAPDDIHASPPSSSSFAPLRSDSGLEPGPFPLIESVAPTTAPEIHVIHAPTQPMEPIETVATVRSPATAPSVPAAAPADGPELAEAVRQAEGLFGAGMLGRVRDAVLVYTLEWVLAALFVAARRPSRKSCNLPVVGWGFVLNTLGNWKREGSPSPRVLEAMRTARGPSADPSSRGPSADQSAGPKRNQTPTVADVEERAREAKLRAAWAGLAESEREAIRAAVKAENPGLSRWPNVLEPLCLAALEVRMASHEPGRVPRFPATSPRG